MANTYTFLKNVLTGSTQPYRVRVPFAAGSSQTAERGDFLELSGGNFTPLTSDKAMAATVAICDHEITASHMAGYYPAIIPVPGDVFRATIPSAAAARGAALYVTGAQTVTTVAGTNIIGHVLDHAGFPRQQGNATVGDVADRGTTVQAQTTVHMTIKNAASYWNALQGDSVV